MRRFSLSLKISFSFISLSIATLIFLYIVFYQLFEQHMLKVEREKAQLIAQTIEPILGMNAYLGLVDELKQVAEQIVNHEQVIGLSIRIKNEEIWSNAGGSQEEGIIVTYPINDPVNQSEIGDINLVYSMDAFRKAIDDGQRRLIYYLATLSCLFVAFIFVMRYLLAPLGKIARTVKDYRLGDPVDFSEIRLEPETAAITSALNNMVANIREYTILLERYKHSVDESSIVSKIDLDGNITYVNNEFCRVSGYSREELIGASMYIVRHPDVEDAVCKGLWDMLKAKQIWKASIKNKRKDGEAYYVKSTIVPILDEHDDIIEFISIQHDITQIIEQQEQILRQTTDTITGLPNRIKLEEDYKQLKQPKFAMLAIDNYNIIKDYYGYVIGNSTLVEITSLLREFLHNKDVSLYKLASGEFGLLASDSVDIDFFHLICKHLIQKVDDHIVQVEGGSFNVRASAGITSDRDHLLSYASLALQHAQENRKSTLVYEEAENLIQQYENNLIWTRKLKNALQHDKIVVYVQPIFNVNTMLIEKYECLVRMIDEDDKVISPFFFLDIAKKSKLYNQITKRVMVRAFEIFSKIPDVTFSVNLSVDDILDIDTVDYIKDLLIKYDISRRLVIELVESEGIESFAEIKVFIADMKSMGCKIAIDDFGTGYSNFAYLLQLNVDYIKIDGSLIKIIDHDINSQIITSTILDFSKQLEISTVAEFVHSESVLNYVTNIGVDFVQGFHLGEPVPIESLIVAS